MTEATILRATLLRGLREARSVERVGGINRYGLGSSENYQRALVRYRVMRANGTLDRFWWGL